jgi:RNA polymerase sigma-70 factor (sigma-E family)
MKPSGSAAESLAEVFRCRRSELVRLGAFILGDRAAAEDIVQDVFLRMHQRVERLADLDDPLPYLRGAVVNGCRSVLRRRLLIRRHADKDQPCPPLSAEEAMLLSEDRRQVLAALARLPARRREVLVLRYAGLSEAEIAATLGISTGTVKSTAARGLAAAGTSHQRLRDHCGGVVASRLAADRRDLGDRRRPHLLRGGVQRQGMSGPGGSRRHLLRSAWDKILQVRR